MPPFSLTWLKQGSKLDRSQSRKRTLCGPFSIFGPDAPSPPRRCIVEPRAPKRLPKWNPKVTLLGTSRKSFFAAIYTVCSTFEVPDGPPNRSYFGRHYRALFFEAPRLQKGTKGRFEAILGSFWAAICDPFWHHLAVFLGGLKFHAFLGRFWEGPASGARPMEA